MSIEPRFIQIIGVPVDLGAGRRGVDMGPSAIRVADLQARLEALGHKVEDTGDLDVRIPETQQVGEGKLRYKEPILAMCDALRQSVDAALERGRVPLVLGGDHSLAIGSVAGSAGHYAREGRTLGLLWFDAHGDANTPDTTPSGNIHGMSLAVALGHGDRDLVSLGDRVPKIQPRNTALIGIRDVDPGERETLKRLGVTVYTMRDIDERGMRAVMEEALRMAGRGTAGYHISLDMDWIDPEDAPGVGTPVWGGATYREAHLAMEIIADHGRMLSFEIVEVNPVIDEHNQTADLAVELSLSAFGKKIL